MFSAGYPETDLVLGPKSSRDGILLFSDSYKYYKRYANILRSKESSRGVWRSENKI